MSTYKQMFANHESEYLLQKRALGDDLADDAHKAIEEIFAERGERLPPRPSRPIFIVNAESPDSNAGSKFKTAALLLVALLSIGATKAIAKTWIGVLISVCVVAYLSFESLRKRSLEPHERGLEEHARKAEEEGLSELMTSAADGDLERVRELTSFGCEVNAKSPSGATALMYAVRNNQLAVAKFLVSAGADINTSSAKGSTALTIAKKFGHSDLVAYLEQHGA